MTLLNNKYMENSESNAILPEKYYSKNWRDYPESYYLLSDGNKMPKVGFGTYAINDPDELFKIIVDSGYRHIDTGSYYMNEEAIGTAIQRVLKETDIKREDLYIVTKMWGNERDDVEGAIKRSLAKLQLDYLDLYLMHWSNAYKIGEDGKPYIAKIPNHKTWSEMENLVEKGLTKSIGVSNFNVQSLLDMLAFWNLPPVCNQIELHPYLVQENLVEFMKKNNILPTAYCPLKPGVWTGHGVPTSFSENETVKELTEKYGKTLNQIVLNWGLQRGHAVIPKSTKYERQIENIECQLFKLEEEDVKKISKMNWGYRVCTTYDADFSLYSDLFA